MGTVKRINDVNEKKELKQRTTEKSQRDSEF
ncbi:MAG: hypothetical protein H6Q23_2427 [Bacteroidetes bacterium]|nr:hypothetical protein [Bacteroidota bacterium]